MIHLDGATVMLQWAVGGLLFLWVTTRRREVGLGYGWLLRGVFGLMAMGAFAIGAVAGHPSAGRSVCALLCATAAAATLAVSVSRRKAGVAGQVALAVLSRAAEAGLTVKSGLIVGMGETDEEVLGALADLRAVGTDIVTIGQYLRPTARHLPVARWVPPETFEFYKRCGEALGIAHVQSSPLTRSSYHARQAADGVRGAVDAAAGTPS